MGVMELSGMRTRVPIDVESFEIERNVHSKTSTRVLRIFALCSFDRRCDGCDRDLERAKVLRRSLRQEPYLSCYTVSILRKAHRVIVSDSIAAMFWNSANRRAELDRRHVRHKCS
jgi:hypothetical protein